jgi:hypothetical protein
MAGDLLWAPALSQLLADELPQDRVGLQATPVVTGSTSHGLTVGLKRAVPVLAPVAA